MALRGHQETAGDTVKIGARLRAARLAQRLSLAEVAERSDLTKGFLSKLERDQANASVAALIRLCAALDVPVGSLFQAARGELVAVSDRPPINFGGDHVREFLLTPAGEKRMQAILSVIEPGGGSGKEPYGLPSDVEFAFVISGEVVVEVAGRALVLGEGDAFTFPPSAEHTFLAPESGTGAQILWVLSPALPDTPSGGDDGAPRNVSRAQLWRKVRDGKSETES